MRLPYPERFSWKYVFLFATALLILQLAGGTDPLWALMCGSYIALFALAFNAAGGLIYPSGAYIFFSGMLIVIVSVVWKALLFLPGESYLHYPFRTMVVENCCMFSFWMAVLASKRFTLKRGVLPSLPENCTMYQAAIGCMVLGFLFVILFGSGGVQSASIGSAVAQINRFPEFAIMLATTYEIRASKGKRAFNWVVLLTGAYIFIIGGIIYSSKEGMFQAPVTWLITAAANGYRIRPRQILLGGIFVFFLFYYMIPYSQYVRNFRDKDGLRANNEKVALEYIFKLNEVRELAVVDNTVYLSLPHFYNKPQGLMDRLGMLPFDDALVERTEAGYIFGLWPTYQAILNNVPKFIWRNKPEYAVANVYGRELSILGDDDVTTGISFGVAGDAYHEATWYGLFLVVPLAAFAFFLSNDSLIGSTKESPWALLIVVYVSHIAPEGMIPSLISASGNGLIVIAAMAIFIRYPIAYSFRLLKSGDKGIPFNSGIGQPLSPSGRLRPGDQAPGT